MMLAKIDIKGVAIGTPSRLTSPKKNSFYNDHCIPFGLWSAPKLLNILLS